MPYVSYCQSLPTRRRKDSDTENDRQNGLRMKNEMTMNEKRFSFLPTRNKEKRKADPHCTHLQIAQADAQTKICKRVQFLPTRQDKTNQFTLESIFDECISFSKQKLPLLFSETFDSKSKRSSVDGEIGVNI
jgi:hypothetical protein